MIVGIDVHKRAHVAALVDERGGQVATLTVVNSPAGHRRLTDWLGDHQAADAIVGVESPGSYRRCLVAALAGAGFEVLHVPAWRTHRERHRRGPGKMAVAYAAIENGGKIYQSHVGEQVTTPRTAGIVSTVPNKVRPQAQHPEPQRDPDGALGGAAPRGRARST